MEPLLNKEYKNSQKTEKGTYLLLGPDVLYGLIIRTERKQREKELTWVLLNKLVNVDASATAASIEHDPMKGARRWYFHLYWNLWRQQIVHAGMMVEYAVAVIIQMAVVQGVVIVCCFS